jgi:PAS domain S-box-containing protein
MSTDRPANWHAAARGSNPIRYQLRWLAVIRIGGLVIFATLALAALFQIKVNGPLHRKIALSSDLIANYVAPSESLLEPALICARLAATPEQGLRDRYARSLQVFESEFHRQYAQYMIRVPEGELKTLMRGEALETAEEYFSQAAKLIALVNQGRREEARALLVKQMNPLYERHAAAVDRIVIRAREEAHATEAEAARSVGFFTAAMIAIGGLNVIALSALTWVISGGIARQADALILAEESRRHHAQLLESVLSSMAEGVVTLDGSGKVIVWNREAERLLGARPFEYNASAWAESIGIYLDDGVTLCSTETSPLYQAMRGREAHVELLIKNPLNLADVWIEANAMPIRDRTGAVNGCVSVFRDTTDRKRIEAALRATEAESSRSLGFTRLLLEASPAFIVSIGPGGRTATANVAFLDRFGYTLTEVVGQEYLEMFVPEEDRPRLRDVFQQIVSSGLYTQNESWVIGKSGERFLVEWRGRPVAGADGRIDVFVCVGVDITERRRDEESRRDAYDELERRVVERTAELVMAREAAESADRLKSAFLATMSHELRTPLNSIIGFTGILLQGLAGELNAEQEKQLGMVQVSSRHLLALINDVLDISKIEAGQLQLRAEPFNLKDSIENVIRSVEHLAEAKGLEVSSTVDSSVGMVTGDSRRVEQVLLNLLSNAIKFTEKGAVSVNCTIENGQFAARVRDTGIGIAAQDLAQLFRPFRQIDSGLGRQREGTGLGLSICRKLAQLMGGTISVESVAGQGSTFTFCFQHGQEGYK